MRLTWVSFSSVAVDRADSFALGGFSGWLLGSWLWGGLFFGGLGGEDAGSEESEYNLESNGIIMGLFRLLFWRF